MPTIDQAKAQRALNALGVTPQALEAIRRSPSFPVAKQLLAQLKGQAKAKYRQLALDCHPDRTGGDKAKEELFKLVSQVWEDLQKLEIRPPAPQPVVRVMFVQQAPVTTTTTTVTGTGGPTNETWASWNNRSTTTSQSRPSRSRVANPAHVVNMRPSS